MMEKYLKALSRGPQITFEKLLSINVSRCAKWHENGVDDWTPEKWITAIVGELGEMANVTKKLFRIRDGMIGSKLSVAELEQMEADEWGDTVLYLILFAAARRIHPTEALRRVFNRKSEELGFEERI